MTTDVETGRTVRRYPFSRAHALDMDPTYRGLRSDEPLSRVRAPYGGECWLAVRHADVRTVLSDPRFSRSATVGEDVPRPRPEIDHQTSSILNMDPPEHTRLRKLVARAFTARRVADLRPRTVELTRGLLDDLRAAGSPADLVAHVSMPLPVTIICEMLGVPVSERSVFRAGADAALSTTSMTPEQRAAARDEMLGFMARLIAERRAEPADDLLTALVQARDSDDRLSEDELLAMGVGILIAGHETTMNHLANFVFTVLTTPGMADALRADPDAVGPAVEELLRIVPLGAGSGFPRVALEDVELGGVTVRAGESVMVAIHSANRDGSVFDDPETLHADRAENPHVAFGHGPHHCLGAQLARMEMQVALGELLRAFPGLRLAVPPDEVPWRSGALVRGPRELLLAWD